LFSRGFSVCEQDAVDQRSGPVISGNNSHGDRESSPTIALPPEPDAEGDPILKRGKDDDDDKCADGVGVVKAWKKLRRKLCVGLPG
jgi:hypothetical protein